MKRASARSAARLGFLDEVPPLRPGARRDTEGSEGGMEERPTGEV